MPVHVINGQDGVGDNIPADWAGAADTITGSRLENLRTGGNAADMLTGGNREDALLLSGNGTLPAVDTVIEMRSARTGTGCRARPRPGSVPPGRIWTPAGS